MENGFQIKLSIRNLREKDGQGMFGEISLQGCGGKMPWEVSSDLFGLAVNIWNVLVFCILASK